MLIIQGLVGLFGLIGLAWLASENRQRPPWRWVAGALAAQAGLALILLKIPAAWSALTFLGSGVEALDRAAKTGAAFVFGYLGGGPAPFTVTDPGAAVIVAFQILPVVIVTAAVAALLWHWRILPWLICQFARALEKGLGISGAAGLGTAATLFFGVVEAPLFIRGALKKLSRPDLFMVMTAALTTVSGVVLVLYATLIEGIVPDAAGHIITASVISLPAAVLIARIMVPDDGSISLTPATDDQDALRYDSSLDAIVRGTMDGLDLFLVIIAVLIVVFAFVSLADGVLAFLPTVGGEAVTLTRLFGWLFAPLVLLFGIPFEDAASAGQLMGTKAILNEFVAYQQMAGGIGAELSGHSRLIMTYALCGFANLASIAMLVSAISRLVPDRRAEVAGLGWRAWIGGNIASGMTGAVVGIVS